MLISDSHEFIFVLVRKAASSSVRDYLLPYSLPRPASRLAHLKSRLRLENDYRKHVFRLHDGIDAARSRMPPDRFARYFKFAVVRNPWERLVSEYCYTLDRTDHPRHRRVKRAGGFAGFVRMMVPRPDAYQTSVLCDRDGCLLMDRVIKLEQLDGAWPGLCERLGIPCRELPRMNRTERRPYSEYYDPETEDLVSRHWGREAELLGYSFGDP